jgi:hypothetical protein
MALADSTTGTTHTDTARVDWSPSVCYNTHSQKRNRERHEMQRTITTLRKVDRDTWLTMTFITYWTLIIIATR